ncbi:MAG: HAD-IC family P-type ATPase, partial [Lachnospiraceae bacterium]|nr:HAD-IC family P-type ATPase [Lachnospiraceae bacterium]
MKLLMEKLETFLEKGGTKKDIILLVISGVSLLLSLTGWNPFSFDLAWISIILCGVPIILEAIIGLVTAFDIKADVLVSIALIASVCIGEDFAAGEVAFIMQLGGLLEDLTVARARAGIEKLVHLTPQTARLITDGTEKIIPAEEVPVDALLRVLPGETVPVDGVITSGQTSVNQAVMTGESLPVDKAVGDEVSSGTVNQFGAFEMRATKVGEDSSIQRMIRLVQSADAGKAKIVGVADRWATWIVVIALSAAALTWFISGEILRAVTILVVFCPCALVLATPTAIMAAIGNATKHGFLVREGDALERLASVTKITFDKTGTLTYGTPQVVDFVSIIDEMSDTELYHFCASAEQFSEHPLGKAIVRSYNQDNNTLLLPCEKFQMLPGLGGCAEVSGKNILAGNLEM